jgi:sugar-specific transcriptional regulator TrmB
MSLERIKKALIQLGLTETEAEVYLYLATQGPQPAKNIGEALKISQSQLYSTLSHLRQKRIVKISPNQSALFSAVPFEETMEIFRDNLLEDAKRSEQKKNELLSIWRKKVV